MAVSPVDHQMPKPGASPELQAVNLELVAHATRLESTLRALVLDVLVREQERVQDHMSALEEEIEQEIEHEIEQEINDDAKGAISEVAGPLEDELAEARQELSMLSECESRVLLSTERALPEQAASAEEAYEPLEAGEGAERQRLLLSALQMLSHPYSAYEEPPLHLRDGESEVLVAGTTAAAAEARAAELEERVRAQEARACAAEARAAAAEARAAEAEHRAEQLEAQVRWEERQAQQAVSAQAVREDEEREVEERQRRWRMEAEAAQLRAKLGLPPSPTRPLSPGGERGGSNASRCRGRASRPLF